VSTEAETELGIAGPVEAAASRAGPDAAGSESADPPTGETGSGAAAARPGGSSRSRAARWLALVCVAAALLPIVVATARAVADDWVAVGENAYFALRADDVASDDHPWLGTWTSASLSVGVDMNNPGPLYFDALAIPVKLGGDAGLAVGVALLNAAAVVGIAAIAWRQAGARAVVPAMLAAGGLGWAMGSELLFDPWQPNALMLPFLCFLMLVWGLTNGDTWLLPWTAALATYIVQTHIGFVVVVPILGAWGVGLLAVRLWRTRRDQPERWPAERRRALRATAVAVVATSAGWAQTVHEQFFGPGTGNLSRLAEGAGEPQTRVGVRDGARVVADVVALPPWWGRPSMSDALTMANPLPSLRSSVLGLLAVALVLVGAALWSRRRRDGVATSAVATALVVFVVTPAAVTTTPEGVLGLAAHHVRWLWPVALFLTFAVVMAVLPPLTDGRPRRLATPAGASLAAVAVAVVVLGALALPHDNAGAGPSAEADAMPSIRALRPQIETLRDERGVLFDVNELNFGDSFSVPLMYELERLGAPWFVDDPSLPRQVGDSRTWRGSASVRMYLLEGEAARRPPPPGVERIGFVDAISDDEAAELAALREELTPFITGGGLRIKPGVTEDNLLPRASAQVAAITDAQLRDAELLFSRRTLDVLLRLGALDDAPPRIQPLLDRYAELQRAADTLTVGVFVEPWEGG
jgi:hypothetical protein